MCRRSISSTWLVMRWRRHDQHAPSIEGSSCSATWSLVIVPSKTSTTLAKTYPSRGARPRQACVRLTDARAAEGRGACSGIIARACITCSLKALKARSNGMSDETRSMNCRWQMEHGRTCGAERCGNCVRSRAKWCGMGSVPPQLDRSDLEMRVSSSSKHALYLGE